MNIQRETLRDEEEVIVHLTGHVICSLEWILSSPTPSVDDVVIPTGLLLEDWMNNLSNTMKRDMLDKDTTADDLACQHKRILHANLARVQVTMDSASWTSEHSLDEQHNTNTWGMHVDKGKGCWTGPDPFKIDKAARLEQIEAGSQTARQLQAELDKIYAWHTNLTSTVGSSRLQAGGNKPLCASSQLPGDSHLQ